MSVESVELTPGTWLPVAEFCRRTKQGKWAWAQTRRRAQEQGITLSRRIGNTVFVSVDRFFQFLDAIAEAEAD